MTDQDVDILIKRALLDAIKLDCKKEVYKSPSFEPTARYKRSIKSMLKNPIKWAQGKIRPVWKTALQKVAMILLVFFLGLGGVMTVSTTARAAMFQWVIEWYNTHITYRFLGGHPSFDTMPQYEITALPEGFIEIESKRIEEPYYVAKIYQNETGDQIYFDYTYMQQGAAIDVLTEDIIIDDISVNGKEGKIYLTNDLTEMDNTIIWIDSESNIQFAIDAKLDQTKMIRLAESVSLME